MKGRSRWSWYVQTSMACLVLFLVAGIAQAKPYELTRNNVTDPKAFTSMDISLYGVKLGDSEQEAVDKLVNSRHSGVKAEQEGVFILLWDQGNPTGAMAGVRLMDGKVDLIFINDRFAYKTRGIFRHVLTSESPDDIRDILGKEDVGDENVMGAMLKYEDEGYLVNYLGRDINVEFTIPF